MSRPLDPSGIPEQTPKRADRLRAMGGVLRDVPSDETDDGWGQPPTVDSANGEAALRREVPPHHGA